jgi:dsRNA-specific ribonuclease
MFVPSHAKTTTKYLSKAGKNIVGNRCLDKFNKYLYNLARNIKKRSKRLKKKHFKNPKIHFSLYKNIEIVLLLHNKPRSRAV